MLLQYPFYKQSTEYTCGPTVLRMVFRKHALVKDERSLARYAKTQVEWGTQHAGMIKTAQKHGFFVFIRRNSGVDDLREFVRKGYAVVVDWTEPHEQEGHYSLLIGFTKKRVIYHDPWWGRERSMKVNKFIKHWHEDGTKDYGWMMVLGKHPIPTHLKGRHYHAKK